MRMNKRRKSTVVKNRAIALVTVIMLVVSMSSLTILAVAEDADYSPVVDTVDVYIPSDSGLNTESATDSGQDHEPEAYEPDSSDPDVSADGDINAESPSDSAYNQDDSSDADYTNNASEPEDGYDYNELENECECICDYYCDYDCLCECEYCECGYVEIEALAEFMVTDWDGLLDVFTNLMTTDGPYTVDVMGSITMSAQLNIPAGRTVNLAGGGALYQPTANARHFGVDGTLVLNEIRLSGTGTANHRGGVLINSTGYLYLLSGGGAIVGNRAEYGGGVENNGTFTMSGGSIIDNDADYGGGVNSSHGSHFVMSNGVIGNNIATRGPYPFSAGNGGGVRIVSGSTFIMNGGSIYANTSNQGGGLSVEGGTFTFNGGSISNNVAQPFWARGGGIFIQSTFTSASYMTMNGGIVSGNTSVYGGGIAIMGGTLTMTGGSISGNETARGHLGTSNYEGSGGGVYNRGTFTMTGGMIRDNSAANRGGGVFVGYWSVFTMYDGVISSNTGCGVSVVYGTLTMYDGSINGNTRGGIDTWRSSIIEDGVSKITMYGGEISYNGGFGGVEIVYPTTFTMNGGEINDNTSTSLGGGVSVQDQGIFVMNNGEISGNSAIQGGGGVDVGTGGTFMMTGGEIRNNTATTNGGGVRVAGAGWGGLFLATFNMTGGSIMNNTALTGDGGGIFTAFHIYEDPLPPIGTPELYTNINIEVENVTISGNTAGGGRFAVPVNAYILPFGHLLNNYEINFRGSHRVEVITFDLADGNVNSSTSDIEVIIACGTQIGIMNIPTPERAGYNFTGWAIGEGILTSTEVSEKVVDASMTFVAQWAWAFVPCCPDCCVGEEHCDNDCCDYFELCCVNCCMGEEECHDPCVCDCCVECGSTGCPICTVSQYRNLRIYYYLQDGNSLDRDTDNNADGRSYTVRAGEFFNLSGVLDRNTLDSENDYIFEGWRVYVGGVYNSAYLVGKNTSILHGTFRVPVVTTGSIQELSQNIIASVRQSNETVGDTIALKAIWSIYDATDENGNGTDTDGTGNRDSQQKLPATGIESNVVTWSVLLSLALLIGLGAVVMTREISRNYSRK